MEAVTPFFIPERLRTLNGAGWGERAGRGLAFSIPEWRVREGLEVSGRAGELGSVWGKPGLERNNGFALRGQGALAGGPVGDLVGSESRLDRLVQRERSTPVIVT